MSNIIPFNNENGEEAIYHVFNYHGEHYALVHFEEKGEVSYSKVHFNEDGTMDMTQLPKENVMSLHDEIFSIFFLRSMNSEETNDYDFALLVYFEFEEKTYASYYGKDNNHLIIFEIESNKPIKIDDELRAKRVKKHFEINYEVEWLDS